jgi:hypothetical protein
MTKAAVAALLALALCGTAQAAWSAGASGSSIAAAKTMLGGNVPSGSVAGNAVTLTWTATNFAQGGAVPGYVVRRFNNIGGAEATVLAACSGTVAATSCVESGVPIGQWRYTITPAAGAWRGTQSGQSAAITVLP